MIKCYYKIATDSQIQNTILSIICESVAILFYESF